jgi:hypothetical protein
MKIVVFDLDETLGYFTDLGMFLDCLSKTLYNREIIQDEFNQILDLYPEFIRPNIIAILNYLHLFSFETPILQGKKNEKIM